MNTEFSFISHGLNKKILIAEAYFMNAHVGLNHVVKLLKGEAFFDTNTNIIIPILHNISHGLEMFLKGIYSYINKTDDFKEIRKLGGPNGHHLTPMYNKVLESLRDYSFKNSYHRNTIIGAYQYLVNQLSDVIDLADDDNATIVFRYGESTKVSEYSFIAEEDSILIDISHVNVTFFALRDIMKVITTFLYSNEV